MSATVEKAPWALDEFLFVEVSEPRRYQQGSMKRQGFDAIRFDKQRFSVVTLYDHSRGHGEVKSITLRNPAPEFLEKIKSPHVWEIKRHQVTLVTDLGTKVDRTFRVVMLLSPTGPVVMSNTLQRQLDGFTENVQYVNPDTGEIETYIGYVNSRGETELTSEGRRMDKLAKTSESED